MASVALLGAHLALSGYVCTSGGWYFAKKEWYQCNQHYPWSTSSFFLISFICKRKLLLPYYQTIVVWQFTLNSLSFICRTLQMIYSCYLMHLRITSSACWVLLILLRTHFQRCTACYRWELAKQGTIKYEKGHVTNLICILARDCASLCNIW